MVKEVKAWEASDGTIFKFKDKEMAVNYENRLTTTASLISKYEANKTQIIEYISQLIGKAVKERDVHCDMRGWDCDDDNNPVGKCVYNYDYDDECCVYCDGPEERK